MKLLQVPFFEKYCPLNKKEPAEGLEVYYLLHQSISPLPNKPPPLELMSTKIPPGAYAIIYSNESKSVTPCYRWLGFKILKIKISHKSFFKDPQN